MSDDRDARELEEEARGLLGAVREPPVTPPDVRARALARLMADLPAVPGGSAVDPRGTVGGALGRALAARVPAWSLVVSFAAGGAVVAVMTRQSTPVAPTAPPAPAWVASSAPRAEPSSAVPMAPPTADEATAPSAPTPSASTAPPTGSSRTQASPRLAEGTLEEERALLDVARTALGRGDGGNALQAAEAHRRRFPRGAMAEEREAIRIQALRLLHRDEEARARLDRFRERFPTSLMRPALEADDGGSR